MPLSYAVDGIKLVTNSGITYSIITADMILDVTVVAGCTLLALVLGAATLRRQTP